MTNVQGTKVLIAAKPAQEWADCAAVKAGLHAGVEVLCPQSLGDLTRTRTMSENSCVSSNDSVKAAGKMSYADFQMELLFDMNDIDGQKKLLEAFESNKPVMVGLVAINGDIIFTEALISGDGMAYPTDGLIGYNVTISPYNGFHKCGWKSMLPSDCSLSIGGTSMTEYNLAGFLYKTCHLFK